MKYKQIKDLPFQKKGSIWEVGNKDYDEVIINGTNYTLTSPGLWLGLVKYYTDDNGLIDMQGEYFEIAGSNEEKKLEIKKQINKLLSEKQYYQDKINNINNSLENIKEEK